MGLPQQQPSPTPAANAAGAISVTFLAVNDDDGKPRVMRLVLSASDAGVLAVLEDHEENEQATLERAGFADCASGLHVFVDPNEYERIRAMGCQPAPTSA
jgi:hypothetical protein